jgi:hypothetical protein
MTQTTQAMFDLERMISASVDRVREAMVVRPWAAREARAKLEAERRENEVRKRTLALAGQPITEDRPRLTVIDGGRR